MFDSSIMLPLFATLLGLAMFAVFDFYAFSPRPSGLALRSRELAPVLTIVCALGIAALSLSLQSQPFDDSLISAGANYAPRTVNAERIRLLTYPLVVTSPFESVLLGLALITSAIFLGGRLGLLGWAVVITGTTISTGVVAVVSDPSGLHYGPFELTVGLFTASLYAFLRMHRRSLQRLILGPVTADQVMHLSVLALAFIGLVAAGGLSSLSFRSELVLTAMLVASAMTSFLYVVKKHAGPHWESTSLFFVSGIGSFVVCGFILYLAPRGFDQKKWRSEAASVAVEIGEELKTAMLPLVQGSSLAPETETLFAQRLEHSATRVRSLVENADRFPKLDSEDLRRIESLKILGRTLTILERVHRSRASLADADRRMNAAALHSSDPTQSDALYEFWQRHRPWMDAELVSLRHAVHDPSDSYLSFLTALDADLERLTQAALDIEIRRVDVWIEWAARQPRSRLPSMKQIAIEQAAHLESLTTATQAMRLPPDPRINSLHRDLRRMASVSSPLNWE